MFFPKPGSWRAAPKIKSKGCRLNSSFYLELMKTDSSPCLFGAQKFQNLATKAWKPPWPWSSGSSVNICLVLDFKKTKTKKNQKTKTILGPVFNRLKMYSCSLFIVILVWVAGTRHQQPENGKPTEYQVVKATIGLRWFILVFVFPFLSPRFFWASNPFCDLC